MLYLSNRKKLLRKHLPISDCVCKNHIQLNKRLQELILCDITLTIYEFNYTLSPPTRAKPDQHPDSEANNIKKRQSLKVRIRVIPCSYQQQNRRGSIPV